MYENKMESNFKIVWHRDVEMDGNLEVSIQNNILQGNIEIKKNVKNKMESNFRIVWHRDVEIEGKFKVSAQNNVLQGCIKIKRNLKNKMEAEFRTLLPERKIENLTSIKDTYVTDLKPSLNFGESSIIKVGRDEQGNIYRTLIEFNIPLFLQNMYITKAQLKLYSDNISSFKGLEISLPNKSWGEYNVVWYGQPSRKKIVTTVDLDENKYEHTIDITEITKELWVLYPYENQGLLLKAQNEILEQIKNFGTKESTNPAQLEIEYFDKDLFSITGSVISGNIRVQRNEWSYLNGSISVFRHSGDSEINGSIHIKNMDMLEGNIDVAQINNGLIGRIKTEMLRKDLVGNICVNKEKLHGLIKVRALKELYGYIKTQPYKDLNGEIYVRYKNDLFASIIVNSLENKDLNSVVKVSVKKDLNCRISVKYKNDLDGVIIVNPLENKDLNSLVKISDKKDLNGKINVEYKNNLDGNINVAYIKDLEGNIRSTYTANKDLEGLIKIVLKTKLQGLLKVNPVGFEGKIDVNSISHIDGQIVTNAKKELYGHIVTNIKSDLDGQMKVKTMDIDDLSCVIVVGENPNVQYDYRLYAFIM